MLHDPSLLSRNQDSILSFPSIVIISSPERFNTSIFVALSLPHQVTTMLFFLLQLIALSSALPWDGPMVTDAAVLGTGPFEWNPEPTPPPKANLHRRQLPGDSTCAFYRASFCKNPRRSKTSNSRGKH